MNHRQEILLPTSLVLLLSVSWAHAQTYEPNWQPVGTYRAVNTWNAGKPASAQTWSPYYNPSPLFQPGGMMYSGAVVATPTTAAPIQVVPAPTAPQAMTVPVNPVVQSAPLPQPAPVAPQAAIQVTQTPLPATVPQTPTPPVVQQPVPQQQPPIQQQPLPQQMPVPTTPVQPAAELPAVANTNVIPQPQPAPAPVQTQPVQTPAVQATPQQQLAVQSEPDAPYEDSRVFVKGNRRWAEISIAEYTSRFHPTDNPEQAVREWIDRFAAEADWNGPSPADIAVSSQVVKVYHSPEIHDKLSSFLGRFTNYVPGKFNCRVQIVNVESPKWLNRYRDQLQTVASANGRHVWLINSAAAEQLATEMRKGSGALVLTSEEFAVANGQSARVRWVEDPNVAPAAVDTATSLRPDYSVASGAAALNVDNVELEFSPLIGEDAASIDIVTHLSARSTVKKFELFKFASNKEKLPGDARTAELRNMVRIPPGKQLLIGIDGVPTLNPKKFRYKPNRDAIILALISISDAGNQIVGVPTGPQTAQATPAVPFSAVAAKQPAPAPVSARPEFELLGRSL